MSGVTVATMHEVEVLALDAGLPSASRAAGRRCRRAPRSGAATRRSRIPVRATIHSSDVSTSFASSSFVTTRSGTEEPSPVIETALPLARLPITVPPRTSALPRHASSSPTRASTFARPIGAAHALELAAERQLVARLDDPLEAHVVDAGEERQLAAVLLRDEHGDRAGLRAAPRP